MEQPQQSMQQQFAPNQVCKDGLCYKLILGMIPRSRRMSDHADQLFSLITFVSWRWRYWKNYVCEAPPDGRV